MSYILNLRKYIKNDPLIMVCSAAILIKNGKILLQHRKDNLKWAIHGGAMELGESLEEALFREVKEEVNIEIKSFEYFKVFSGKDFKMTYPNGDQVYIVDHIYIVTDYQGEIKPQLEEVLELRWFEFDEIPWDDLMEHNKIILREFLDKYAKK